MTITRNKTLQPFALYDSLVRLGLARAGALSVEVLDISPRVIDHLERARERARKGVGYAIQRAVRQCTISERHISEHKKSRGGP